MMAGAEMRKLTPKAIAEVTEAARGVWTAELVFDRLCEAVKVAHVCVRHPGPSSKMVATLEIEPDTIKDVSISRTKRTAATPDEIARMEESLNWMARLVIDERARVMLAQLAKARAIGGNFRSVCKKRRWGKTNAYETCNVNLRAIAGALNRAKTPIRL